MFLAKVYVTLKPTVNDPQGKIILHGLKSLGFELATDVRTGKYLEIKISDAGREQANANIDDMCKKLLANPVIESYRYELEEIANQV